MVRIASYLTHSFLFWAEESGPNVNKSVE